LLGPFRVGAAALHDLDEASLLGVALQIEGSVLSWNVAPPSNSFSVSAHHWLCSGRSLLRRAASSDSKRTTVMNRPSSVAPPVEPSQPSAPGARSFIHRSSAAPIASASNTLP
jgi:hypothetical protein